MNPWSRPLAIARAQRGFSLIEMSVVLVILGLVLATGLAVIGPQLQQHKYTQTHRQMQATSDAIVAFAMANGRLPCPATSASNGLEAWCTGVAGGCALTTDPSQAGAQRGRCFVNEGATTVGNGWVPARSLGLAGQNASGLLVDSYAGTIGYSVTAVTNTTANFDTPTVAAGGACTVASPCYPATQLNGLRNAYYDPGTGTWGAGMSATGTVICSTETGITPTSCGTSAATAATVSFVVLSYGNNFADTAPLGVGEQANRDNTRRFVLLTLSNQNLGARYFDDLLVWVTPSRLLKHMADAGVANP